MTRYPMTKKGELLLREELKGLKSKDRNEVVKAIAEARELGDLKENAEYHAAKEQQGLIERRIREIETKLADAQVIDIKNIEESGKAIFGTTVELEDLEENKKITFKIVGEDEADAKLGKISFLSPLARNLIGKNQGEEFKVETPGGVKEYLILSVQHIWTLPKNSNKDYKFGDSFSKRAKDLGYRSRSSFKLKEIQEKDKLLLKGMRVLDLGSSPGGWSQVTKEIVGEKGKIISVDLKDMQEIKGVVFIKKDISLIEEADISFEEEFFPFDVVLSDIAPNISGIGSRDQILMINLLEKIIFIIENYLKKGGRVLIKAFQGESLDFITNYMKSRFETVRIRKPNSSRHRSKEYYALGNYLK